MNKKQVLISRPLSGRHGLPRKDGTQREVTVELHPSPLSAVKIYGVMVLFIVFRD